MPDSHPLLPTLLKSLDDIQANDITVIDVSSQTPVTDYMIICSGRSSRHINAIAQNIMEDMKAAGLPALSYHGFANSDWALIDFGDFVVHAMLPDSRTFYNLEGLWQVTP